MHVAPCLDKTRRRTRGDAIPVIVGRAAVLYGMLIAVSVVWNTSRDRGFPLYDGAMLLSVTLGVGCAFLTFSLGYVGYRLVPVMRRLAEEMSGFLVGATNRVGLVALAFLSGVGEEVFFRGTLQAEFGIVAASLVFGLAHIGPDRRYLLWTAWAVAAGFLFGGLYELTGGLLAPVIAHVLHNGVTLLFWRGRGKVAGE